MSQGQYILFLKHEKINAPEPTPPPLIPASPTPPEPTPPPSDKYTKHKLYKTEGSYSGIQERVNKISKKEEFLKDVNCFVIIFISLNTNFAIKSYVEYKYYDNNEVERLVDEIENQKSSFKEIKVNNKIEMLQVDNANANINSSDFYNSIRFRPMTEGQTSENVLVNDGTNISVVPGNSAEIKQLKLDVQSNQLDKEIKILIDELFRIEIIV